MDEQKKITRPIGYDRVKWLVMRVVQNLSKNEILDEFAKDEIYSSVSTLEKAFEDFKNYNLPVMD